MLHQRRFPDLNRRESALSGKGGADDAVPVPDSVIAMKTLLLLLCTLCSTLLSSCSSGPSPENMTAEQREAYVDHRRWDWEAENRKKIDEEHRR